MSSESGNLSRSFLRASIIILGLVLSTLSKHSKEADKTKELSKECHPKREQINSCFSYLPVFLENNQKQIEERTAHSWAFSIIHKYGSHKQDLKDCAEVPKECTPEIYNLIEKF